MACRHRQPSIIRPTAKEIEAVYMAQFIPVGGSDAHTVGYNSWKHSKLKYGVQLQLCMNTCVGEPRKPLRTMSRRCNNTNQCTIRYLHDSGCKCQCLETHKTKHSEVKEEAGGTVTLLSQWENSSINGAHPGLIGLYSTRKISLRWRYGYNLKCTVFSQPRSQAFPANSPPRLSPLRRVSGESLGTGLQFSYCSSLIYTTKSN